MIHTNLGAMSLAGLVSSHKGRLADSVALFHRGGEGYVDGLVGVQSSVTTAKESKNICQVIGALIELSALLRMRFFMDTAADADFWSSGWRYAAREAFELADSGRSEVTSSLRTRARAEYALALLHTDEAEEALTLARGLPFPIEVQEKTAQAFFLATVGLVHVRLRVGVSQGELLMSQAYGFAAETLKQRGKHFEAVYKGLCIEILVMQARGKALVRGQEAEAGIFLSKAEIFATQLRIKGLQSYADMVTGLRKRLDLALVA